MIDLFENVQRHTLVSAEGPTGREMGGKYVGILTRSMPRCAQTAAIPRFNLLPQQRAFVEQQSHWPPRILAG
jgi:hypothetical protein